MLQLDFTKALTDRVKNVIITLLLTNEDIDYPTLAKQLNCTVLDLINYSSGVKPWPRHLILTLVKKNNVPVTWITKGDIPEDPLDAANENLLDNTTDDKIRILKDYLDIK